jgi:Lon protease-like protein
VADRLPLLPLFPLGTVLFPGALLPLHVFEPRYRVLVEDLLAAPEPRRFAIVAIREGHEVGADALRATYDVGCVAEVVEVQPAADRRYALLVLGGPRCRLLELDRARPYLQAEVELLDEPTGDDAALATAAARARDAFAAYHRILPRGEGPADLPGDATALSYALAARLLVALPERQALLAAADTERRLRAAAELLTREVAVMRDLRAVPMPQPPLPRDRLN